jgi:hypothetical protein
MEAGNRAVTTCITMGKYIFLFLVESFNSIFLDVFELAAPDAENFFLL